MNIAFLRTARVLFGLLGLSSIVLEIIVLLGEGTFNPTNFFSFFTVLSNIFAGLFLLYFGFSNDTSSKTQLIRGAVTLYMAMTGIIFALLLAGLDNVRLTAVPWNNIVVHYIMPIVIVADWLLYPPKSSISLKTIFIWISFPSVYVVYTIVRGSIVSWYPYPFFNPNNSSYAQVLVTLIVMTMFVLAGAFGLRKYAATRTHNEHTDN